MKITIGFLMFLVVTGCGGTRSHRPSGGGVDDGGVARDGDCPEQGTLYISARPFEEEIHAGRGAPQDFSVPLRFWSVGERIRVEGITFWFFSEDDVVWDDLSNMQLTDGAGNAFSSAEVCPCDHGHKYLMLNQPFRTTGTDTPSLMQFNFRIHPRGRDRFDGILQVGVGADAQDHPSVTATGEESACRGRLTPEHRLSCVWDATCP